jgi:hypothetical protein
MRGFAAVTVAVSHRPVTVLFSAAFFAQLQPVFVFVNKAGE